MTPKVRVLFDDGQEITTLSKLINWKRNGPLKTRVVCWWPIFE